MSERNGQRQYRLSKRLWHYQMVRLDHDDAQALRNLAERKSTSVAELIRTYVAWGLENDYGARALMRVFETRDGCSTLEMHRGGGFHKYFNCLRSRRALHWRILFCIILAKGIP